MKIINSIFTVIFKAYSIGAFVAFCVMVFLCPVIGSFACSYVVGEKIQKININRETELNLMTLTFMSHLGFLLCMGYLIN